MPDPHRKGMFGLRLLRNCAYVTPHMPLPQVMTQASLDAQPILTMGGLSAYMNKLAAYMSKGRSSGQDKRQLGAKLFEECRNRSTHGGGRFRRHREVHQPNSGTGGDCGH